MTFANPTALIWGLLAVPIIGAYFRRGRIRRETTATGMFWRRVLAEQASRSAWERWRRPVSLAVQLIVLTLIVVAMAEPIGSPPSRIVLVVDNTLSPAEVKESAGKAIDRLRPCDRMAILTTAGAVGVRCNFTGEKAILRDALAGIECRDGPSRADRVEGVLKRMNDANRPPVVAFFIGSGQSDNQSMPSNTPWWSFLACVAMVALAAEWAFYQRRWTC